MMYEFPVGDGLVWNYKSFTNKELIESMLFCSECVLGGMHENVKHLSFTVTMHLSFYLAILFTIIHLSFILHICNFPDIKITTYKSAVTCCTFIISFFGYILSAIASIVINENPAFFSFFDLSMIIGTFQLFIHILWLFGMISIVKGDDDDEIFDVNDETFPV